MLAWSEAEVKKELSEFEPSANGTDVNYQFPKAFAQMQSTGKK